MTQRIRTLPPEITMKIAAGEVIERPASIVKELLENAIDAQASSVKIELKDGGKGEIAVTDNGHGIDPREISQAFLRYATSKISSFDDLYSIKSFGFRGEALPSIASVSRVEMVSRPPEEPIGARIVIEEGKIIEEREIGCPAGTAVRVTRLFNNLPVRRKFLKSAATEQSYCLETITRILMGIEDLRAEVIIDGRRVLLLPNLIRSEERLVILLGREAADHLTPIKTATEGPYRVSGFISSPDWPRANSKGIYCYVNRRPVKDVIVNHALLQAYKNVLPPGKYPLAVIKLEVPPNEVDVNVHPAKMEVRFENPQKVYSLVTESIIHSLSKFSPDISKRAEIHHRVEEAIERYYEDAKRPLPITLSWPSREEKPADDFTYLGQIDGSYLIFQTPQGLVIVDQHAAHERVLFDRLSKKGRGAISASQSLLVPILISLTPHEFSSLEDVIPILTDLGFEIEPFGPNTIALKAIPAILSAEEGPSFLRELIAEFNVRSTSLTEKRDKLLATLACKGAVTAHRLITAEGACHLFRDLRETASPATCPHGRPTFLHFTYEELERMFKRR